MGSRFLLLVRGNTKLGRRIFSFSIPARQTCPGRSQLCEKLCYAERGHFLRPTNARRFARLLTLSRHKRFITRMTDEIQQRRAGIVRIHVAGDFYDAAYVRRWLAIARRCPEVRFLAYTRSWRVPRIRRALADLAAEANVRLWYSCDRETGVPATFPARVRLAWMACDDDDVPPSGTGMVFRVQRKTVRKQLGSVQVCPPENGITRTDCQRCGMCYVDHKSPTSGQRVPLAMAG